MFYSKYGSDIFRTRRATSSKLIFLSNSKKLITRMCKQGGRIKTFSLTLANALEEIFKHLKNSFQLPPILQNN